MSKLISARDIQEMIRNGGVSIPEDAILTPSAREALQDYEMNGNKSVVTTATASAPKAETMPIRGVHSDKHVPAPVVPAACAPPMTAYLALGHANRNRGSYALPHMA